MLRWSKKERISPRDLVFIADRMSLVQIDVYKRQKQHLPVEPAKKFDTLPVDASPKTEQPAAENEQADELPVRGNVTEQMCIRDSPYPWLPCPGWMPFAFNSS